MEQVLLLPIDGIKLNRTLTGLLGTRSGDAVMRHLIALAADLELSTVVEGIETRQQAEQAHHHGSTLGQGHLWSPPISGAEMTAFLGHRPASPTGNLDQHSVLLAGLGEPPGQRPAAR